MLSSVCNDYSRDYCLSSCMQVARGRSPMRSTTPLGRSASRSLSRLRSRSPSPRRSARGSRTYRVYGVSSTIIVLVVYFAKRLIAWRVVSFVLTTVFFCYCRCRVTKPPGNILMSLSGGPTGAVWPNSRKYLVV
jgi:hypothetical protein